MNGNWAYTLRACAGLFVFGSSMFALAAEPIRIGAPLSLTGSLADEGGKEQHGLDMCIEAVNAKGGVQVATRSFIRWR
jgi:branched-chain amino acid transport system substrate-binding protein